MLPAILVAILAALLFALAALLLLPLHLRFDARSSPHPRLRVEVRALGGHAPGLAVYDSARPRRARTPPKKRRRRRRGRQRTTPSGARMARALPRLIAGFLRQVRLLRLDGSARIGLGDPADTGWLFGLAQPVLRGTGLGRRLSLHPDFEAQVFDGWLAGEIAILPARLLPPSLRFAWAAFGPERAT